MKKKIITILLCMVLFSQLGIFARADSNNNHQNFETDVATDLTADADPTSSGQGEKNTYIDTRTQEEIEDDLIDDNLDDIFDDIGGGGGGGGYPGGGLPSPTLPDHNNLPDYDPNRALQNSVLGLLYRLMLRSQYYST